MFFWTVVGGRDLHDLQLRKVDVDAEDLGRVFEIAGHIHGHRQVAGLLQRRDEREGQIVAAAERLGCDRILTEDLNDGQVYCSITAVDPFKQ